MIAFTDKITLIEVVWTAIAVGGLGTCIWALIDSVYDLFELRRTQQNGLGLMVVWINLRSGSAGITLHLFFLMLGLAALLTVNRAQSVTGDGLAYGFIVVAAHNAATVFYNQLARVRLRRQLGASRLIVKS